MLILFANSFCDASLSSLILLTNFYDTATVGLHKILSLLQSDDAGVRIHAVKVVANLAAEGI